MANADLSDSIPAAPRVPWIIGVHSVVAFFVVVWIGGLALHVWTAHLFFTNWGTFAAIVAFLSPPFAELAAIPLVCFWWGPWFYILAIASWVTALLSIGSLSLAEESANSQRMFGAVAFAMYIFVLSFSFCAVRAATTPKIVSESEREEIEEVSCVMCAVLNDCAIFDSGGLSGVMEAKDRLRRRMRKYDALRRGEVRKTVDAYLYARALLERDFRRFLEDGGGANRRFIVSEESRQAFSSLPAKMRLNADAEVDAVEDSIQQHFKAPWTSSGNVLEKYNVSTERQWRGMREVYEDLLKTPMPSREEFLAGGRGWQKGRF